MTNKKKRKKIRIIAWIWVVFALPFLFVGAMFGLAALGAFGKLPSFKELENPQNNLASIVYSADGKVLGKYYVENRVNIAYNEISQNIIHALISTEDVRFYQHSGIDFIALARASTALLTGKFDGGGSTITQQLAKNLFHKSPNSKWARIKQKFKEWVIALQLERRYTKNEILTMYLNTADFGHNVFGIFSASKVFFGKKPALLELHEAALLVGMLKAPTAYSPIMNPDNSKHRRMIVLHQMLKNKKINEQQYEKYKALPLIENQSDLFVRIERNKYGIGELAPYFLAELKKDMEMWCENHTKPDGTNYNLYTDGLRIYTTIDSRMQSYAEQAVKTYMPKLQALFFKKKKNNENGPFSYRISDEKIERIIQRAIKSSKRYKKMKAAGATEKEIKKAFNTEQKMTVFSWKGDVDTTMTPRDSIIYYKHFLQNGIMAIDPHTGFIKAWVGGNNFEAVKYDHVRAGYYSEEKDAIVPGFRRQVGSTFKPFVYLMAMEAGRSPCEKVPNVKVCIEEGVPRPWCPDNAGSYKEGEMISLRKALANSVNWISALLMKQYGPEAVINNVRKMGITAPIPAVPSICLGTPDISVYEMVGAFATFFNKGVHNTPVFIIRIEDKNGNLLDQYQPKSNEVLSEKTAYLMVELLKGVVYQGTAGRLRYRYNFDYPVAGKTGTTQNNSDGWFIGATPDLVTGIWTGAADRSVHFYSTAYGQGANMALPIWAIFMKKVYNDASIKINRGNFDKPANPVSALLNCSDYQDQLENLNSGQNLPTSINFD